MSNDWILSKHTDDPIWCWRVVNRTTGDWHGFGLTGGGCDRPVPKARRVLMWLLARLPLVLPLGLSLLVAVARTIASRIRL